MSPEEYQARMREFGIERGKLAPEGRFPLDYGANPAVGHEPHVFTKLMGARRPELEEAGAVGDWAHLNPRGSQVSREWQRRRWERMTAAERAAKAEQLRRNGRGNVARSQPQRRVGAEDASA